METRSDTESFWAGNSHWEFSAAFPIFLMRSFVGKDLWCHPVPGAGNSQQLFGFLVENSWFFLRMEKENGKEKKGGKKRRGEKKAGKNGGKRKGGKKRRENKWQENKYQENKNVGK